MKMILLALALVAGTVHAAEEGGDTPCDAVENDQQTLECATFNKTTAEQLLSENLQGLTERLGALYGNNSAQLMDITGKLQAAQALWQKQRDADCAVETFPAKPGSKAYTIAHNDCLARMSDERSEFLESIGQQ
ncbi:lysozyme inhibitor LprI family protein [Pseudomonas sp. Irchel 3E20]|uniref:lysozyme inhibitor LprI family protein n=1 Tax=Pseudomonas sp. Irchel 3E20 TaxID=2008983 RepID=UPI000BA416F8|nr:lysozyme inhibitor LprI family protein [Pseudomonas sp. Irchel 3E20]